MCDLQFSPVQNAHKTIILEWLEKPHVKKYYYGQGLQNTLSNLDLYVKRIRTNGKYTFDFWIAYIDKDPLGLLMTSPIEGPLNTKDPYNKWVEKGKEIITLDLLIGEEKYLGKGLGEKMIRKFLLEKFPHVSKVLIDPEAKNTKAIHIYEKVGFQKVEEFLPDYDPIPHWMMHLEISQLKEKNK